MENDYLWMSCCIVYTGDMIPILSWTTDKADNTIASDTSTADNRKLPMTTNSSIIRQLGSGDNGVTFKCNIRFRLSSNSEGNPPEYEYTWNYTIRVLCKQKIARITIIAISYRIHHGHLPIQPANRCC